ncbi:NADH-quinone oxidoreductase subunit NuoK [Mycolicibacterium pyrenivorans]|uniref:NADH-quinone oxidoreductase subunit NuoK n=1 Tax=Mycolicibacterium pyrenivorans TaxID=187102 RepID=UPI0021F277AA|nr:NADH-quinone oxidoreductase subunit K [Mycolicibacterium pyrenivorans]MCV7154499.1 NADH-quinone oxidoreductase subunit K [Mycolicibacterium pyrenivorans]
MILQTLLLVAAALFCVGLYGALSQQVVVMVMMGLELMINAVILAAAGLWWFLAPAPTGQVLLMVIIAAMTVEMAMGFAVATLLHRDRQADMTDMATDLSG